MAPSATTLNQNYEVNKTEPLSSKQLYVGHQGKEAAKKVITDMMSDRASKIDLENCEVGEGDAFIVADLGDVYRQHMRWKSHLGRVKPHYAVKCAPDNEVLRLLAKLGTGFDCASIGEIEKILSLGVDPSRIIYANPAKESSHMRKACKLGIKQTVFDNEDELLKTKKFFPNAELFLRILVDDSASQCRLSQKYGAPLDTTTELLSLAKTLKLNVIGVSFHCGSGVSDPTAFSKAVEDARTVFDIASDVGFDLRVLDVGGGFTDKGFESMANTLNKALDENFPPSVRFIGEPGRYYVSSAFTVACHVITRRAEVIRGSKTGLGAEEKGFKIYLNDGVYGNFASLIYDHQQVEPRILCKRDPSTQPTMYSIWGQTCDGLDQIKLGASLDGVLNVHDWLYFEEMGAYTICCATEFNGFTNKHDIMYMSSEPGASALLGYDDVPGAD